MPKPIDRNKETQQMIEIYLKQFKARLTGSRPRKSHTVEVYMGIARDFLEWTGKAEGINADDVSNYIAYLRNQGQAEVTLKGKMSRLKKLNQVCEFFKWKFEKEDIPAAPPDYESVTPVMTLQQMELLIRAQSKYTEAERFYLAISTIFGCRREALCQINTRNISENEIVIPGVKGGRSIKHLIPPVLKPVILAYHPKKHTARALTYMFQRIAGKAGLELPKAFKSQGMSWHSLRRGLTTLAEHFVPKCKDPGGKDPLPQSVWADYVGWSKVEKGRSFMSSGMAGHYSHFEAMYKDPFWLDKCIFAGHPLLKIWSEELRPRRKK
ncbi:MAG: hypothetical protein PHU23_18340 [Dehalococcoidales bacterium]|nr:hypothetical protein [Dehalococcoidales bacterium]